MCSVNFQIQSINGVRTGYEMSGYHILKIIHMVKSNMDMDESELTENINNMLLDDYMAITGFGDD